MPKKTLEGILSILKYHTYTSRHCQALLKCSVLGSITAGTTHLILSGRPGRLSTRTSLVPASGPARWYLCSLARPDSQ